MTRILKGVSPVTGTTRLPAHAQEARTPQLSAPIDFGDAVKRTTEATAAAPAPAVSRVELDALRARASREGYEQGRRSAEQDARESLERQQAEIRKTLDGLESAVTRKLDELEQLAVAVAFEACARVLGEALLDRGAITSVVRLLLDQTGEPARLLVQVPPEDLERVRAALEHDEHWRHRQLQFEADPSLEAGACRVVTPHGQLETSLDVQLRGIQDSLLAAFSQRAVERERG